MVYAGKESATVELVDVSRVIQEMLELRLQDWISPSMAVLFLRIQISKTLTNLLSDLGGLWTAGRPTWKQST